MSQRRPRRLAALTALFAVVLAVLPFTTAQSPIAVRADLAVFDIFFGVGGFIIMGWTSIWLWRRGRGLRAAAGAFAALGLIISLVVIRSAGFAQADYERGRLPFALAVAMMTTVSAAGLWWAAARQRD